MTATYVIGPLRTEYIHSGAVEGQGCGGPLQPAVRNRERQEKKKEPDIILCGMERGIYITIYLWVGMRRVAPLSASVHNQRARVGD